MFPRFVAMRAFCSQALGRWLPALLVVLVGSSPAWAAPSAEQRQQVERAKLAIRAADRLIQSGRAVDAVEQVKKAQAEVAAFAASEPDADAKAFVGPVMKQLEGLYVLLELEGIEPPAMPKAEQKKQAMKNEPQPGEPTLGPRPEPPAAVPPGGVVSFSKQIAPLLVVKCGRCHVDEAKGKIRLSTYAALMKGSPTAGAIVTPGKGADSRIVEVIESGDMPRGGARVSPADLAMLIAWIDQGAKNDGPDENTPLRQLARAQMPDAPKAARATGKETVSFGLHIAPVLISQCFECHNNETDRGNLSMATFASLLRGGDGGPPILPGKPAESLLVQMITSEGEDRMPYRRPPLSADVIAKIKTWIAEGAKFDGETPDTSLARVAAFVLARNSNAEQLTEQRAKIAEQNWRLAIPDIQPKRRATKNFLVVGNVGEETLAKVGALAEAQAAKLGDVLPDAQGKPVAKGRVTLFVFANRFDYGEFGTMVEKRQLPRAWSGHWRYDLVDPYIAVAYSNDEADSLDTVLAHQILSIYLAGRGEGTAPRWLAEGAGRALAAKLDPRDPIVQQWDDALPTVFSRMNKADDFLMGKLSPQDADLASYSFAQFLLTSRSRFGKLLKALDAGAPFGAALQQAYGAPAPQLALGWGKWLSRK
jgi:hypothetical protein